MLGITKNSPAQLQSLARVKAWTRTRFALAGDDVVMVTELACALPGCPPLETVVAFWCNGNTRHHFKIFKRVNEVTEDDLPFAWMKPALTVDAGYDAYCC